jgi:hypothetical protein
VWTETKVFKPPRNEKVLLWLLEGQYAAIGYIYRTKDGSELYKIDKTDYPPNMVSHWAKLNIPGK